MITVTTEMQMRGMIKVEILECMKYMNSIVDGRDIVQLGKMSLYVMRQILLVIASVIC